MAYSIVISSGHGKYVRGASGNPGLDEVDEARKVVEYLAAALSDRGVQVKTFHDDVSKDQSANLKWIVDHHNGQGKHDLDVSIHFNAYSQTSKPMGTECLYLTQSTLAGEISAAVASCGFINRGAKKRTDLYFLNNTKAAAILVEVCFVDSDTDVAIYRAHFDEICERMADVLGGTNINVAPKPLPPSKPITDVYTVTGTCSYFGGPDDQGVSPSEGLAFIYDVDDAPQLFLPFQPEGTTGLARRLNPYVHYFACRFDYSKMPKTEIIKHMGLVTAKKTGIAIRAFPADWGPHEEKTGRAADLSPKLMEDLGIKTDDEVTVIFPFDNGES